MCTPRTLAHGVTSACISAVMRCYYAVNIRNSEDKTYWLFKSGLWNLSEIASGILAMCLPVSHKFFRSLKESSFWSKLRSSFQSFFRFEFQAPWTSGNHSCEHMATKGNGRSSWFKEGSGNKAMLVGSEVRKTDI